MRKIRIGMTLELDVEVQEELLEREVEDNVMIDR